MSGTPICDFVRQYAERHPIRLHMPGHKGVPILGFESLDITEFDGADDLFAPHGIIAESEAFAGALFGADTFYSTAGSTLCIQAMLHLLAVHAGAQGKKPRVLAGRNAHKAFLHAAALLDFEIEWLLPQTGTPYLSCAVAPEQLEAVLQNEQSPPTAVYLTSPDYLGNCLNLRELAAVCHKFGVLLAVDNAHGAYLKFLPESRHPMDLGVDLCCDSAHKTLPVLTGGAYLHLAKHLPGWFAQRAKISLSLFGSSSPSYLILQSLDAANGQMEIFRASLADFLPKADALKTALTAHGFLLTGEEPLKLTIMPKSFGYTGTQLAQILEAHGIFPEFHDPDYLVLLLSPQLCDGALQTLTRVLCAVKPRSPIETLPPPVAISESVLTPREALFAESEILPAEDCLGRISAAAAIGCPPAIPLILCGERISRQTITAFQYYGIRQCPVISEKTRS